MKSYGTNLHAEATPTKSSAVADADLDMNPNATLGAQRRMAFVAVALVIGMVSIAVCKTPSGGSANPLSVSSLEETSNMCSACSGLSDSECLLALGSKWKALPDQEREALTTIYDMPTSKSSFSAASLLDTLTTICYAEGARFSITAEEAKAVAESEKAAMVADAQSTLKTFDTDGSGGISVHEWISVFRGSGRDYDVKDILDFLDANDANGDSEIDAEEAFAAGDLTETALNQDGLLATQLFESSDYDEECCTGGCWCLFLFCPSFTCWWYECKDNWCCISACSGNFYCQNSGCGC